MKTTNIQEAFKAIKKDGRLFAQRVGADGYYTVRENDMMCIQNVFDFGDGSPKILNAPIPIANKPRDYGMETFTVEQIVSDWVIVTRAEIDAIDREEYMKQK